MTLPSLTDEQRLFAAKYVENGCQLPLAAKALKWSYGKAYKTRAHHGVQAEIDRLIGMANRSACVSREWWLAKHLEVIETALTPTPKLYKGRATKVLQIEAGPALTALRQLADQGFLLDEKEANVAEGEDVDSRITDICNILRARRAREAAPSEAKPEKVSKVRRVRTGNV